MSAIYKRDARQPPGIIYVLVHQDEHVGTFLTLQDAFDEGTQRYGDPPFTVIEARIEGRGSADAQPWTPLALEFDPDPIPFQPERRWYKRSPKYWFRGVQDYPPS